MLGKKNKNYHIGFTVIELLVVIVVIAILAIITAVVFAGVQQRARDAARVSSMAAIQKAVQMYFNVYGMYPACNGGVPTNPVSSCVTSSLSNALVPEFIAQLPSPPPNGEPFYYARGWKKTGTVVHTQVNSDQYDSMGTRLETGNAGTGAWGTQINYMVGNG